MLRKRSLMISGHATSVSLEDDYWRILKMLAQEKGMTLAALITRVDEQRTGNLSSALRVYVLNALCQRCGLLGGGATKALF